MPREKAPDDRKSQTIQIRVTAAQRELLQFAADAHRLELSTWLRVLALTEAQTKFDLAPKLRKVRK